MRRLWFRYACWRRAVWTRREVDARQDLRDSISQGNMLAERIAEAHVTAAMAKRRQWAATARAVNQ